MRVYVPSMLYGYYSSSDVNGRVSSLESQEMQGTMGWSSFLLQGRLNVAELKGQQQTPPSPLSWVLCSPPPPPDPQPRGEEYTEALSLSLFSNACSREWPLAANAHEPLAGSKVFVSQTGPQGPQAPAVGAQAPRLACLVKNEFRRGGIR